MSTDEGKLLCESAQRFEQAGIAHPIISVYEMQKTKVRKGMFNQKSMVFLTCFPLLAWKGLMDISRSSTAQLSSRAQEERSQWVSMQITGPCAMSISAKPAIRSYVSKSVKLFRMHA